MKRVLRISIIVIVLFFGFSTMQVESLEVTPTDLHPRIVTYQYLTTCEECGDDRMEGYHSLVDGYTEELCRICGYYTVIEAYSDVKTVVHESNKEK